MSMFNGFHASASALTAQRLRMDVVSSNMANAETTRGELVDGEWQPYRRKMVSLSPNQSNQSFQSFLNKELGGVKVSAIEQDTTPFKMVFQPDHPDANEEGYVEMPNVDPLREMVDLMGATRSYEANVTALNASKNMLLKTLEIGK
ncbi:flagellar basal body rod protein FlgC [Alkalicoccobacillus murimartini]|uniref:Flagellar basal-body rod protein FlgC n=1 Tax=Alkalicoccobacillus murimartini TaxID=171685 RepID=A0ABT9YF54_9BACI|nr:flagellar basal body rod protein FlgC [Alkalicoccobacillus murimartini]MDQ0206349.1 flagellar basal-body rod protein FlgC [Alkalicoccobacillus murimartini]